MKKITLAFILALALTLSACGATSSVSEGKTDSSVDGLRKELEVSESILNEDTEDNKTNIFEDAYCCSGDIQKVYDYTWKSLSQIYSMGLQEEYRTVVMEDKNYGVLIFKSQASTPFELISELKHNYAGYQNTEFQAIYDDTAMVFTDEYFYYQYVDGTKSQKDYWSEGWLDKNSEIYDEFLDWSRRTGNSNADVSPWQVIDDEDWTVWNVNRGSFVFDPEHLENEVGASMDTLVFSSSSVTVYSELYGAGDIVNLDMLKTLSK